jgi:hypothetical protein
LDEWKNYAGKLAAGVLADAPKVTAAPADIIQAAKKDETLANELEKNLEKNMELVSALRAELEETTAELASQVLKRQEEEKKRTDALAEREAAERSAVLERQKLESELETLQMRLRIGGGEEKKGGAEAAGAEVFLAEMAALTERLNATRAELLNSEAERKKAEARAEVLEREMTDLRSALQCSVPLAEHEELKRQIAELQLWRDSSDARKARVFRPIKSGEKKNGASAAFAEKLDHTELRKGLKSVSAEKKLW